MIKDPDARLDYAWDWTAWLGDDTISSADVIAPEGITVDSHAIDGTVVRAWLSGGTAGATHRVVCRVTTTGGRTDDRTIPLVIVER